MFSIPLSLSPIFSPTLQTTHPTIPITTLLSLTSVSLSLTCCPTLPVGVLLGDSREDVSHKEADCLGVGREHVVSDEVAHQPNVTLTAHTHTHTQSIDGLHCTVQRSSLSLLGKNVLQRFFGRGCKRLVYSHYLGFVTWADRPVLWNGVSLLVGGYESISISLPSDTRNGRNREWQVFCKQKYKTPHRRFQTC